jgi:hypothetical protein
VAGRDHIEEADERRAASPAASGVAGEAPAWPEVTAARSALRRHWTTARVEQRLTDQRFRILDFKLARATADKAAATRHLRVHNRLEDDTPVAEIARCLGLDRSRVIKGLRRLVDDGFLGVARESRGGGRHRKVGGRWRGRSKIYFMVPPNSDHASPLTGLNSDRTTVFAGHRNQLESILDDDDARGPYFLVAEAGALSRQPDLPLSGGRNASPQLIATSPDAVPAPATAGGSARRANLTPISTDAGSVRASAPAVPPVGQLEIEAAAGASSASPPAASPPAVPPVDEVSRRLTAALEGRFGHLLADVSPVVDFIVLGFQLHGRLFPRADLERHVVPAVRRTAANAAQSGKTPRHWNYFRPEIAAELDELGGGPAKHHGGHSREQRHCPRARRRRQTLGQQLLAPWSGSADE